MNRLGGRGTGSEIDVRDVRLGDLRPTIVDDFWRKRIFVAEQQICIVGGDHGVISWFKPLEEYLDIEREWFDGGEQDSEVFGGFFTWLFDRLQKKNSLRLPKATS